MKYIIYKIQIKDYIYIGSTKNFTIRKSQHKRDCNNGKGYLVYNTIREHGGWDCCTMVPIREIEVESKLQARIIEEEARVGYNAQMNTIRAHQTDDERSETVREAHRKYRQSDVGKEARRQYNQTDAIKEYQRQYYLAKKAAKDLEETPSPSIV